MKALIARDITINHLRRSLVVQGNGSFTPDTWKHLKPDHLAKLESVAGQWVPVDTTQFRHPQRLVLKLDEGRLTVVMFDVVDICGDIRTTSRVCPVGHESPPETERRCVTCGRTGLSSTKTPYQLSLGQVVRELVRKAAYDHIMQQGTLLDRSPECATSLTEAIAKTAPYVTSLSFSVPYVDFTCAEVRMQLQLPAHFFKE